jgi:tRNA nucleotidyltransferase (CCA-adding enzyme)
MNRNRGAPVKFSLPFDHALLPSDTYVVGGAVRDALLNRQRAMPDIDLIVPVDAVALAKEIAAQYRAGFVLLDAERSIARLVFPTMTVDFAQQMGGSLETDLRRRDYCMNAIACHLASGELFDPLDGSGDLQRRAVRMVSVENLADDPLRLLRGYRQAAQLGFTLEAATVDAIASLIPLLRNAAAERVLAELRYLLAASHQDASLLAAAIEILASWWPGVARPFLAAELTGVVTAFTQVTERYPLLSAELCKPLRPSLPTSGLDIAFLACILQNEDSTALLTSMAASNAEIESVAKTIQYWPQLGSLDVVDNYNLFQGTSNVFPIVVILGIAKSFSLTAIGYLIEHYLDPQDLLAHPVPLLNGTELMQSLSLSPSPLVGRLLQRIQLARLRGEVSTKQEAVIFAESQLQGDRSPNLID